MVFIGEQIQGYDLAGYHIRELHAQDAFIDDTVIPNPVIPIETRYRRRRLTEDNIARRSVSPEQGQIKEKVGCVNLGDLNAIREAIKL